jgi:hypothetical protein
MPFYRLFVILWVFCSAESAFAQHRSAYALLSELAKSQDAAEQIILHAALVRVYTRDAPEQAARHAKLAADRIKSLPVDSLKLEVLDATAYFLSNRPTPDFRKAAVCIRLVAKLDTSQIQATLRIRWLKTEGYIHTKIQAFEEAHRAYNQMLDLATSLKMTLSQADAMCALGALYIETLQPDIAADYLNKAAVLYQNHNQTTGLAESLVGLALISLQRGDLNKTITLTKKIQNYFTDGQHKDFIAQSFLIEGRALAMRHLDTDALAAFQKCYDIAHKKQVKPLMAESALEMARIKLNDSPDLAKDLVFKALQQLDTVVADKNRATAYHLLYRYYRQTNSAQAVQWLESHQAVQEAINKLENKQNIERNKIRFAVSLKEKENQRLRAQKSQLDTQYERQRFYNLLLLFFLSIVAISGGWVSYASNQRKKQNLQLEGLVEDRTKQLQQANDQLKESAKSLERSNNELERFAYIASHDLKAPLRNIISFLGLIERKIRGYNDESLMQYLTFATTNAHHMHALIQDILEYSKVDASVSQAVYTNFDANEAVLQAVFNVQDMLVERQA